MLVTAAQRALWRIIRDRKGTKVMSDRFDVGDVITMKKPHPCGSKDWEVLRVGADFRLKCKGCGHQIMIPRRLVEKNTRNIIKKT